MAQIEEKQLYRDILDTSRHLLVTDGYAQLSMRRIARAIGYSATSIYLHFKNKDELVHTLIDEGVSLLHERLLRSAGHHADPGKRLEEICREYIRFGLENPEYYEIMYVLHPRQMSRYPADKYRVARQNIEILADAYRNAMGEGAGGNVDPTIAANVMWSHLHGIVSLVLSMRIDSKIDTDVLIEESIGRILAAYLPEGGA